MSPRKLQIFKIYDDTSMLLTRKKAEIDASKMEEIFSQLYSPGLSFQYIFDFNTRKFAYVSETVFDFLGETASTFTVDQFMESIHPEDIHHFMQCEKIAGYFLFKHIDKASIPDYKISYQMRMKDANGCYKLVLHQGIALSVDDDLNLSASLVNHSDISHITANNNYKVSFINIKGGKSYYNIGRTEDFKLQPPTANLLSKREIEILGCLSEGLNSKEIAAHLFISPATVRTHRNNILKKTHFKTLTQAVGYFIREGLI